jgi:hypothetical protein
MIRNLQRAGAMALALLISPASAQQKPLTIDDALEICRVAYLEDAERGKKMFAAVPDEHKQTVAMLCVAYGRGVEDLMRLDRLVKDRNA